ncbi:MAG: stage II sporulation protein M [Planctomycetota bacterium]
MNVAKILEERRAQWQELETLCDSMEFGGKTSKGGDQRHRGAAGVSRFSTLYRAACADLALADSYQLPPATVTYLHRLVARSHSQLYRSGRLDVTTWIDILFRQAPQQIFSDACVRVATVIFFGLFALSLIVAANEDWFPGYAEAVVGGQQLEAIEEIYDQPLFSVDSESSSVDHYVSMSGFYIMHNTGIGLRCFAWGILIIPCLFTLAYNAVTLGTMFGYMAREDVSGSDNFFQFVTAHGPFELTAIALAAAAGLRIGTGWFSTDGLNRIDSLRRAGIQAVPIMAASAALFVLAAFTEGFISPSPLPYLIKATWAIVSSGLISFYFVVLGFPREEGQKPRVASARRHLVRRGG